MNVTIQDTDILVTIIDDDTVNVTAVNPLIGQSALLFKDDGLALGTQGTATVVDFTGSGVAASRSGAVVTVTIPGGGGGGTEATFAEALAGTGSSQMMSPRRVRQVSQKVYNVEAYGAAHDGVTDDTAAIQAAISACVTAGGGIVYFPNGVYIIAGALVTSVSTRNPNCQIYIPPGGIASQLVAITLRGEAGLGEFAFSVNETNGVVLKSTITGSGTAPSILGGAGDATNLFNYNNVFLENITFKSYTSNGASAPTVSCFNGQNIANVSADRCVFTTDVALGSTPNPTGGSTFGAFFGRAANNGPNVVKSCWAGGFKYGLIYSEHTILMNNYVMTCDYGHVFLPGEWLISGRVYFTQCKSGGIYFPTGTFLGASDGGNTSCPVDLYAESEALSSGASWGVQGPFYSDASNYGTGIIKYRYGPGASAPNILTNANADTNLLLIPHNGALPPQLNMAGGPITTSTGVSRQDKAVFEVSSGISTSNANNSAAVNLVTNQSGTGTIPIGVFQVLNSGISAAEKRAFLMGCYTNGAVDTSIIYWYNMIAGALQEIAHIDKNFNFSIPPVLPYYANDSAADAASQGGTAPKGTMYYNTSTDKVKVKENATWKTVTTS